MRFYLQERQFDKSGIFYLAFFTKFEFHSSLSLLSFSLVFLFCVLPLCQATEMLKIPELPAAPSFRPHALSGAACVNCFILTQTMAQCVVVRCPGVGVF